ncbi:hypothetical protein L6452_15889 [Arctium lappa]|uniref:Uncharacterized protein n=1 Tax=Arctium lappa TaxID=4217 RepID=A0ACB9CQ04_ARCLA|nr:hypothetical protein L6452_15889 [Arctium lappa]
MHNVQFLLHIICNRHISPQVHKTSGNNFEEKQEHRICNKINGKIIQMHFCLPSLDYKTLIKSKQGSRSPTLSSISLPPLPLVAIFAIVAFLLSLSQYSNFKTLSSNVGINLQLFVLLTPVILIFFLSSSWITDGRWFSFGSWKRKDSMILNRGSNEYGT